VPKPGLVVLTVLYRIAVSMRTSLGHGSRLAAPSQARKPVNHAIAGLPLINRAVVAVALANKTARIAWAVMQRNENYQRMAAAA
jgi:hypothetical protein